MPICGACGAAGCNCALAVGCGLTLVGDGSPGTPYTLTSALDTEPDNQLVCPGPQGDGLYVPPQVTPLPALGCGLELVGGPTLQAQLDGVTPGNALVCNPGLGLFVPPAVAPVLSAEAFGCFGTGEPNTLGLNGDGLGGLAEHFVVTDNIGSGVFGVNMTVQANPIGASGLGGCAVNPPILGAITTSIIVNPSQCRSMLVASFLTVALATDALQAAIPISHSSNALHLFDNNTGGLVPFLNQNVTESNVGIPDWAPCDPFNARDFRNSRNNSGITTTILAPGAAGTFRTQVSLNEHIRGNNNTLTFSFASGVRLIGWSL